MSKDFQRIAESINFINQHSNEQPSLACLAGHVNLSTHHFHRMFTRYCGVTPKQFLQVLTVEKAKRILSEQRSNLDAALESGLSGSNRLHDHFVKIEAVTPGEYKSEGENLVFYWGTSDCNFGKAIIVWTSKGIHRLEFLTKSDEKPLLSHISALWPKAKIEENGKMAREKIHRAFSPHQSNEELTLWICGTNFQIAVWRALLLIARGELKSYGDVARAIKKPTASRAVGTAIGHNPIAYLIPCHRVIQRSGALGGYRWDVARKQVMLTCELIDQSN